MWMEVDATARKIARLLPKMQKPKMANGIDK